MHLKEDRVTAGDLGEGKKPSFTFSRFVTCQSMLLWPHLIILHTATLCCSLEVPYRYNSMQPGNNGILDLLPVFSPLCCQLINYKKIFFSFKVVYFEPKFPRPHSFLGGVVCLSSNFYILTVHVTFCICGLYSCAINQPTNDWKYLAKTIACIKHVIFFLDIIPQTIQNNNNLYSIYIALGRY